MRAFLLTVNYVALLFALMVLFEATWLAPLNGNARVTALDRHEVFNEVKLREFSPQLAENLRYNVGMWIQESTQSTAVAAAWGMAALVILNIVGCHVLGFKRKNKLVRAEDDALPQTPGKEC